MNFVYEEYGSPHTREIKKADRCDYSFHRLEELFSFLGYAVATTENLRDYFTFRYYQKNEEILSTDKISDKIFFIADGAVRYYRGYENGETTLLLLTEGNFVTSITPFLTSSNSYSNVMATENTFGLYIDLPRYNALINDMPGIAAAFTIGLSRMLYFHQRLSEVLRLDAVHKFDFIHNSLPQLANRFQLNHQASFVGLKPETLSRVRNSFARKFSKKN